MQQLQAARTAWALASSRGARPEEADAASTKASAAVSDVLPSERVETQVNAQVVELAFLCVQFVALSGVFTALNIPDEPFLADEMKNLLPAAVIKHLNELCSL